MNLPPRVVAVSATYRRPAEIRRLATSLGALTQPLHAWVVVDNGGDLNVAEIFALCQAPVIPIRPKANLGCGAALRAAEELALERFGADLTHIWILDDDAVVQPDTLSKLLEVMASEGADAAVPAVTDEDGCIAWAPGFLDRSRLTALKQPFTPAAYLAKWGDKPLPFSWAQGIAFLVSRRALEECGLHRDDFWIRGEDLDFSLRITRRYRGLFVPATQIAHLPPVARSAATPGEYLKDVAMLRNVAYIALRLPHGRRIARTIPGSWVRFLCNWGLRPRVLYDSLKALVIGGVLGRPAGR